jgi:hypothetical protein
VSRDSQPSHPDTLDDALAHYNAVFRHRYRLPSIAKPLLGDAADREDEAIEIAAARADGLSDPACALLARFALSMVPRYAIGFVDGRGRVTVQAPTLGDESVYWSRHVVLLNPLGGYNNWRSVSDWIRRVGSDDVRRRDLAGLASEKRPDQQANEALLRDAMGRHGRAVALPPDEAFSAARAAEVSFIYRVPIDTLRAWKRRHRREQAAGRPGAPPKNR